MIECKFEGLTDLETQLAQLEKPSVIRAVVRKALRAAAKVTQQFARKAAPVDSGETKRAIKVRAVKRTSKFIGVTVMIGEGWFRGKTFYAAFVELGHKLIRGKRVVKTIPAMDWLKNASIASEPEAVMVHDQVLAAEIDKAFKGKVMSDSE